MPFELYFSKIKSRNLHFYINYYKQMLKKLCHGMNKRSWRAGFVPRAVLCPPRPKPHLTGCYCLSCKFTHESLKVGKLFHFAISKLFQFCNNAISVNLINEIVQMKTKPISSDSYANFLLKEDRHLFKIFYFQNVKRIRENSLWYWRKKRKNEMWSVGMFWSIFEFH